MKQSKAVRPGDKVRKLQGRATPAPETNNTEGRKTMKDAMNAKEVLGKVNEMIFEGEEYADNHGGLKMRWRIYDICGELDLLLSFLMCFHNVRAVYAEIFTQHVNLVHPWASFSAKPC